MCHACCGWFRLVSLTCVYLYTLNVCLLHWCVNFMAIQGKRFPSESNSPFEFTCLQNAYINLYRVSASALVISSKTCMCIKPVCSGASKTAENKHGPVQLLLIFRVAFRLKALINNSRTITELKDLKSQKQLAPPARLQLTLSLIPVPAHVSAWAE